MITLANKPAGHRMLELGGGDCPHELTDVNVDVRPGPKTHFAADFNEPLPIANDDFEIVFSQYLLEHISYRKIPQFLKEVFRITKTGGKVIFVTSDTNSQINWASRHPDGWDGRNFFESVSGLLFGDQDYPENSHRSYFDAEILTKLFREVGFHDVQIDSYGARNTDLVVQANVYKDSSEQLSAISSKTSEIASPPPVVPPRQENVVNAKPEAVERERGSPPARLPEFLTPEGRVSLFSKEYFNGGGKFGGYAREGYWDYPVHELTARHVLARAPKSVLELGCGRGYILKRLQDAGVTVKGLEISHHCVMTRVCDNIVQWDLCNLNWPIASDRYDLCFSIATLEHIPEEYLPEIIEEMSHVCKRGLHGIDFGVNDDGFDKTHCTLRSRDWWVNLFETHAPGWPVEIVDKQDLEKGEFPKELLEGDGRFKINIGSSITMFHNGWLNVDVLDLRGFAQQHAYKFLHHDIRNGLPFGTGVVDAIVLSHVLQCLPYDQGLRLLKECRRVIRPDGIMRIAVPDAWLLMNYYLGNQEIGIEYFDHVNDGCAQARAKASKLWALLHAGHESQYDGGILEQVLDAASWGSQSAEFRSTKGKGLGEQILRETLDMQPELSLYMDAIP